MVLTQFVFSSFVLFVMNLFFCLSQAYGGTFVLALKPDKNPDKMKEERLNLEKLLSEKLKKNVRVIIPLSGSVIHQGLKNGQIDMAYVSSMDLLQIERDQSGVLFLVGETEKKSTYYDSLWLVKKESTIKELKDLKNKPIAFSSRTSTSGYLVPFADLIKKGLIKKNESVESFFGRSHVQFASGYGGAIQKLLAGQVEAAAVSDYVFEGDKYLTSQEKDKLRILSRQGPVPGHVLVIKSNNVGLEMDLLKKIFIELQRNEKELFQKVFAYGWKDIPLKEHVKPLEEYLLLTGLDKTWLGNK